MPFSQEFLDERGRHLVAKLSDTKKATERIDILPAAKRYKEVEHIPEIIAAQKRLEDGEYGYCVDCSEEIPTHRLSLLPHVARCIDCQVIKEKKYSLGL